MPSGAAGGPNPPAAAGRSKRGNRPVVLFVLGLSLIGWGAYLFLRGTQVNVDAPHPAPGAAAACRDLTAHLPARLVGQTRRTVNPTSPYTAAWGHPALVLRCGVPTPSALTPTSELTVVDGVAWLPDQPTGGSQFTTVGRVANVEVTVPDSYRPAGDALVDLAAAVAGDVPTSAGGQP
jgi:hypothetical protein